MHISDNENLIDPENNQFLFGDFLFPSRKRVPPLFSIANSRDTSAC